jgi:hypothetical protein
LAGALVLAGVACGKRSPLDSTGDAGAAGGTAGAGSGTGGTAGGPGTGGSGTGTGSTVGTGTGGSSTATGGSSTGIGGSGTGTGGTVGTGGSSGGTVGTGGSGGGTAGSGDAGGFCSPWMGDLAAPNQRAVEELGLYQAKAILEGTLGERFDQASQSWARFTIRKVRAGVTAYEGSVLAIPMSPALHATFGAGASVLVGLSSTYSFMDTVVPTPPNSAPTSWGSLLAVVKKEDEASLPADVIGFRAWHAPNVAVVRVSDLPPGRIAFDVIETLAGSLPTTFLANWSDTWGPLPVGVGDQRLIGVGEIVTIMGSVLATSIVELRPNIAEERARALRGIAALAPGGFAATYRAELDRTREEATRYRLSWTFGRAAQVLDAEVAGVANECCTGAGGTFFASTVAAVLRGLAPTGPVVTGGHGVNRVDACGDRYLYAMRGVATTPTGTLADYTCNTPPGGQVNTSAASSGVDARLPSTAANRDDVGRWLQSASPLLRLNPAGVPEAGAFTPPPPPAVWSVPVHALTAIQARHGLMRLTVMDVQPQPGGGAAVRVTTPPSPTMSDFTLYVPCADPRLLQVGRQWVGAMIGTEPFSTVATQAGELRLMLIPGFLLPAEREDLIAAANGLARVEIPRPLGR